MLSRLVFQRRREIDAALADLEHWAMNAWRDHWAQTEGEDLQDALDGFLPDAMAHAQTMEPLAKVYSARLTRVILLGIAASQTHAITEYEAALGVPMPKGANR